MNVGVDPARPEIDGSKERRLITARVVAQVIGRALIVERPGNQRADQPVFCHPIIRADCQIVGVGAAVAGLIFGVAGIFAAVAAKNTRAALLRLFSTALLITAVERGAAVLHLRRRRLVQQRHLRRGGEYRLDIIRHQAMHLRARMQMIGKEPRLTAIKPGARRRTISGGKARRARHTRGIGDAELARIREDFIENGVDIGTHDIPAAVRDQGLLLGRVIELA